ncbi:MAG: DUF6580 family putative transport protein [Terriglobales bacterium]
MTYGLLLAAMAAGVIPHLPNFSPVFGAMLFGGARLRRRDALWYPLLLMAAAYAAQSLVIYHSHIGWGLVVTTAAMLPVLAAGMLLRRRWSWLRLGAASSVGATGFFLASNFAVWWGNAAFPPTWQGLGLCYLAGVPFYGNSILAGMLFGGFLFAAEAWLQRRRVAAVAMAPR